MNNSITDQKLITAYSKLVNKQTDKITVSLLCKKADVARATFYTHYKDLDDFVNKLKDHIIDKFFEQATALLVCSEADLKEAVKKENLLLNKCELDILRFMISDTNYIGFALDANDYYASQHENSLFSEEVWKKHNEEINLFACGYLMILIFGITQYEETAFTENIKFCRMVFRYLFKEILE